MSNETLNDVNVIKFLMRQYVRNYLWEYCDSAYVLSRKFNISADKFTDGIDENDVSGFTDDEIFKIFGNLTQLDSAIIEDTQTIVRAEEDSKAEVEEEASQQWTDVVNISYMRFQVESWLEDNPKLIIPTLKLIDLSDENIKRIIANVHGIDRLSDIDVPFLYAVLKRSIYNAVNALLNAASSVTSSEKDEQIMDVVITIIFAVLTFFVALFPVFVELHVMWREWRKRVGNNSNIEKSIKKPADQRCVMAVSSDELMRETEDIASDLQNISEQRV